MRDKKHGPFYPPEVLYPERRPRRARSIERAVSKVVAKMKPHSLCICGKFCAVHRKLIEAHHD